MSGKTVEQKRQEQKQGFIVWQKIIANHNGSLSVDISDLSEEVEKGWLFVRPRFKWLNGDYLGQNMCYSFPNGPPETSKPYYPVPQGATSVVYPKYNEDHRRLGKPNFS